MSFFKLGLQFAEHLPRHVRLEFEQLVAALQRQSSNKIPIENLPLDDLATELNIFIKGGALTSKVTIPNARILTLPSQPVQLIKPVVGKRFGVLFVDIETHFSVGYGNINTAAAWTRVLDDVCSFIGNDEQIPMDELTKFFAAGNQQARLEPYSYTEPVNQWGNIAFVRPLQATNKPLLFDIFNNGSGNFTGGAVTNKMIVTTAYTEI